TPGTSVANATNFDGSIVAGQSGLNGNATIWVGGQPLDLGIPASASSSAATSVNDNGTVVGLELVTSALPGFAAGAGPPARGAEPLANSLDASGVSVPLGWSLINCSAVSGDGLTFAGWARFTTGETQGFVATVPAPGAVAPLFSLGVLVAERRRR